eukprot:82214-Pelagomonas_calceolata.AAC.6
MSHVHFALFKNRCSVRGAHVLCPPLAAPSQLLAEHLLLTVLGGAGNAAGKALARTLRSGRAALPVKAEALACRELAPRLVLGARCCPQKSKGSAYTVPREKATIRPTFPGKKKWALAE